MNIIVYHFIDTRMHNVTLNERCNHQNNQTTVSLLKTIPKLSPVHSKTDIPKDLCAERREFTLKASNKLVNVCTYQDRIRVDVREFINDSATIKGLYFTSREFVRPAKHIQYSVD